MNNTITMLGECRLFSDLYPWIHHICLSLSYTCFSDSLVDVHSWSLTHSDSVNHQTCEPKILSVFWARMFRLSPNLWAIYARWLFVIVSFFSAVVCWLLSVGCSVILFPTLIFFPLQNQHVFSFSTSLKVKIIGHSYIILFSLQRITINIIHILSNIRNPYLENLVLANHYYLNNRFLHLRTTNKYSQYRTKLTYKQFYRCQISWSEVPMWRGSTSTSPSASTTSIRWWSAPPWKA